MVAVIHVSNYFVTCARHEEVGMLPVVIPFSFHAGLGRLYKLRPTKLYLVQT